MRLLGNTEEFIDIQKLGLQGNALEDYLEGVNKPNGMVLISGPTGSGKTTSLYATLQELNQTTKNIVTIEDPIEYTLEGINQTQLKESIGLSFASAQRLVRLLCPDCKKEKPFDAKKYPRSFKPEIQLNSHFTANGCQNCFYTGYKGRHGIYEVLPIDEDLADLIKAQNINIKDHLKSRGIQTLANNAFRLFKNGLTSIEEIYPILASGA